MKQKERNRERNVKGGKRKREKLAGINYIV